MERAPLFDTAAGPVRGEAVFVEARDGTRLRAALCRPPGDARGSVVFSTGRAEPLEKYGEAIGEFQARGFVVLVHDWRGQGLSARFPLDDPMKGHARGWRPFVRDLRDVTDAFAERLPRPWIGAGHSMGAALTLLAMAEGAVVFDGAVLSGAMLGLRLGARPPLLVRAVATALVFFGQGGRYSPQAEATRRDGGASGEALTHDAGRWAGFRAVLRAHPELDTGDLTWGWLAFALALCRRLEAMSTLETIGAPVTLVGAEHDRLVTTAAQVAAARRLPHGRYVEAEGAFHEILMESDERRAVFWRCFDEMAERLGA